MMSPNLQEVPVPIQCMDRIPDSVPKFLCWNRVCLDRSSYTKGHVLPDNANIVHLSNSGIEKQTSNILLQIPQRI